MPGMQSLKALLLYVKEQCWTTPPSILITLPFTTNSICKDLYFTPRKVIFTWTMFVRSWQIPCLPAPTQFWKQMCVCARTTICQIFLNGFLIRPHHVLDTLEVTLCVCWAKAKLLKTFGICLTPLPTPSQWFRDQIGPKWAIFKNMLKLLHSVVMQS